MGDSRANTNSIYCVQYLVVRSDQATECQPDGLCTGAGAGADADSDASTVSDAAIGCAATVCMVSRGRETSVASPTEEGLRLEHVVSTRCNWIVGQDLACMTV